MRTLKKTLSLVLVVAMVLGLCVVGASAKDAVENFTDDYQKVGAAYQEAMGVLVGVGIIDGMTETALEPQGTYTREQAAKIIAYMLLGKSKADSLKCTVAPFDDVAASRWSAGYIAFCVEQGIIDGMTATTYEPTGTLTGFQWAKMLLCAIGFGVKGEFTGSSWSVNTALVAHKVNLFAGDLDGADHTALRREQAALYAFNALKTAKVAYSPNVTSYVFGIEGYTTVNNIGSSLATDVYDLKYAQGIIVDAEGMGAGYTVVSKDYSTANVTNKIKADNDIDMMYHAARVWYTGTNTGVYTYDLAKTTTYKCQEIATGTKAATAAKATTGLYVGEKPAAGVKSPAAYEAYLIDNSAVAAGSAYVTLYASFGQLGYVDAAKKTVTADGYTVAAANVRTDISKITYGAPVIVVYTTSTTDKTLHGMYIYAATSTTGIVKGVTQEAGNIVSVTLTDGTVLKVSGIRLTDNVETYVIGNVYTFVLDSHGHIVYATKDYARDLWAYTGDWKFDNEYNGYNSERVISAKFANVTTGEVKDFAVRSFKSDYYANIGVDDFSEYRNILASARGTYYDLSATTTESGIYVATAVTSTDTATSAYASKFVIGNTNFVRSGNYWVENWDFSGKGMYFNPETVTFLVGSGHGSTFEVKTCTGVAGLKEAFNVASNGMLRLSNAAYTITITESGDYRVDTVFVMIEDVQSTSNYVFVPSDILYGNWSSVSGDQGKYFVTYKGAYLNGTAIDVVFHSDLLVGNKIVRGFYTAVKWYDAYGKEYMRLEQKVDNATNELCFYGLPTMRSTGYNGIWEFYGPNASWWNADSNTKIVDFTGHGINSLNSLYQYVTSHKYNVAYTVDPNTERIDCIYVTGTGWDAKYTFTLSSELKAAGWKILLGKDPTATGALVDTYELNDEDAIKKSGQQVTITLYNANLAKERTVTTKYAMTLTENGAVTDGAITNAPLNNGKIEAKFTLAAIDHANNKTFNYVIGGLSLGTVKFAANEGLAIYSGAENKNVVLGQSLTVQVKTSGNVQFKLPDQTVPSSALYNWRGTVTNATNAGDEWTVIGTLNSNSTIVTFSFTPIHIDGTYNVGGVDFPLK